LIIKYKRLKITSFVSPPPAYLDENHFEWMRVATGSSDPTLDSARKAVAHFPADQFSRNLGSIRTDGVVSGLANQVDSGLNLEKMLDLGAFKNSGEGELIFL